MFKKLKEKITEEVKSSPQRFQQLTQSVSDRLQTASTSDENFFSIGDDDTPTMATNYEAGFTNVALTSPTERKFRRNSNSSISSDVSFLPKYESLTNMYHLQSDLDVSASEMEDNASSSSQLGHLSKEQIYSAFQKSQMRYHKYRGRYTDLAKHYKDLEKENGKLKSVLVDTQDKAIRRVTELKEQCSLEQKAKAHLEGALRDEIDEKELKIESLQTKVELLKNSGNGSQDSETLANLNKYLTEARQEIESLNERIQEMKANGIIFQSKEQEYKTKIASLEKEIALFAERERENNLTLAQNKMELHNELVNKDSELSNLKQDNEALRKSLETMTSGNSKLENLQTQNKKLVDRVDTLTSKCNNYESELLKLEQYKVELQNLNSVNGELNNQTRDLQTKLDTVREDAKKSLLSLEDKIQQKLRKEYEEKENETVSHFQRKLEELSGGENDLKEMQLDLMKKEEEAKKLKEQYDKTCTDLKTEIHKYKNLETNHLELIEDSVGLRSKISTLEKEVATLQTNAEASELKFGQLRRHATGLEKEIDHYRNSEHDKDTLIRGLQARQEEDEVKKSNEMEEEKRGLLAIIDEKERKCQEVLQQEEEAKVKLEKLLQDLEISESAVRKLTDGNASLTKELEEAKRRNEEIASLQEEIRRYVQEKDELWQRLVTREEEINKLKNVEAERDRLIQVAKETRELEEVNRRLSSQIQTLEEQIKNLTDCNQLLEEDNGKLRELRGQLDEKDSNVKHHEQILSQLNEELAAVKVSLQKKDEELLLSMKDLAEVRKQQQEERHQILEEVGSLREANGDLLENEEKLKKLEEHSSREIKSLVSQVERSVQIEQELSQRSRDLEGALQLKDQQIEILSKRLDDCNDLIKERNKGIVTIFNNFLIENPINVVSNGEQKQLQSIEEKLQNFENVYSVEKENLSKILTCLKQFEEDYLSMSSERNQLKDEKEHLVEEISSLRKQMQEVGLTNDIVKQMQEELVQLRERNASLVEDEKKSVQNISELEARNTQVVVDSNFLSEENTGLVTEIEELKIRNEEVNTKCNKSQVVINELKTNLTQLEDDLTDANNKLKELTVLEQRLSEMQQEKQQLESELKTISTKTDSASNDEVDQHLQEIEMLKTKIVQYKSLDLTNRSSIEFYENELQKLKNQNEKINRKLDETLVTLNHCSELSNSTEIEYLKNVLYNYMLGKESLVLARVIAAVCKFDPRQTETVLAKEHQKQTLLGQLGLL